jgi:hypothetical protein
VQESATHWRIAIKERWVELMHEAGLHQQFQLRAKNFWWRINGGICSFPSTRWANCRVRALIIAGLINCYR